jgi:hypothetical protein
MSKRPNLAAVAAAAGSTRRSGGTSLSPPESASAPSGRTTAKTRMGTKQIAAHFPEDEAWQLRGLAVERKTEVDPIDRTVWLPR